MSFMEKLLDKSNSYVFYKEQYELLKSNEKKLNKQIDKKNRIISDLNRDNDNYNKLINALEAKFKLNSFDFSKLEIKDINIAYVLSGFPIHSETFIVSEVKWLKEKGFNLIVFVRNDSYKPIELDFEVDIIKFENIIELETLLVQHDIRLMHTHFVYPICTEYTFPVAEKLGIPFTVFAHAYDIFIRENDEKNNIKEISNSKYCKAVFTLSNFHKSYLMERGVEENKIVVTKQATNYELYEIQPKTNEIKNIISISRFVEKKGIDVLIKAAKLLENEDFEFSIYGFGALEEEYRKQIDDLDCKNISIKGELPPNEVRNVLINSDLLVSPCKKAKNGDMDGFPTVIFESMAVGLPFLTTSISAIPEIVIDGVNGFITEPESPEKLAEKIVEISGLSNDELFEIRLKAQEDVKIISSVDNTMNKYLSTIKLDGEIK